MQEGEKHVLHVLHMYAEEIHVCLEEEAPSFCCSFHVFIHISSQSLLLCCSEACEGRNIQVREALGSTYLLPYLLSSEPLLPSCKYDSPPPLSLPRTLCGCSRHFLCIPSNHQQLASRTARAFHAAPSRCRTDAICSTSRLAPLPDPYSLGLSSRQPLFHIFVKACQEPAHDFFPRSSPDSCGQCIPLDALELLRPFQQRSFVASKMEYPLKRVVSFRPEHVQ